MGKHGGREGRRLQKPLLCLVALALSAAMYSQEGGGEIRFYPLEDGLVIASAAALSLGFNYLEDHLESRPGEVSPWSNPLDSLARNPLRPGLSLASDLLVAACLCLPALNALDLERDSLLPGLGLYLEALSLSNAAKEGIKLALPRLRPYAQLAGPDMGGLGGKEAREADESMPSGHATAAFCAATFFAVLRLEYAAGDPSTPYLVGGAYVLASSVATLRIGAGRHYITDSIAGALLGSLCALAVCKVHLQ